MSILSAKTPLIVAEMSGNHRGSLARALELVDAAAACGVDALKLQTYTADTMTLDLADGDFVIRDPRSLWRGMKRHELYRQASTPWEWHEHIFSRCADKGILAFSSPFDETAVDFLERLHVPCYKIASFEMVDLPLIQKVASTGKPIIMSTGMATISEIDEAVQAAREAGCPEIILLKCTSNYPADPSDSNLLTLPHMKSLFHCEVGISDHTLGMGTSIAAVALGAVVVEKHLTLSREEGGVDAEFSIEPEEMALLVKESSQAAASMGRIHYGPAKSEEGARMSRRSLYIVQDMMAGDTFSRDTVRSIRPGYGLPPKYLPIIMGRKINKDARRGTPLSWSLVG